MNTKLAIDKTLKRIASDRLVVTDKKWLKDIKFINKGIAASILFKNVRVTDEIRKEVTKNLQKDRYPDFSELPFDDFCILTDLEYDDNGSVKVIKDNLLIRYTRCETYKEIIFITSYMKSTTLKGFTTLNIKVLDTSDSRFDIVAFDKDFKKILSNETEHVIHQELLMALMALATLKSFEVIKIEQKLTFSERKHVPNNVSDKYIEYTLDLTKPTKKRWMQRKGAQGGSHASPCEHVRRGHLRTYKSGKQVWINGTTINKGSKSGRVEKDYAI